jgi:lipopolysaccharide transport system ATP-binding protein
MTKSDEVILKVENLSKQYRLGLVGTGTLSHDLNRWWHRMCGKEDPYLKIGETNDRSQKGESDYVWALKDINFEVKRGEVLGIIGKNGAGKSTLLKILSKVTSPTTGSVKTRGRIASLLEVGTGFHGEMTGRENIYLNGAILGMTKKEIASKIDEIIDFSGCARYIDTPVKRYSSGMTVRLAFAVAAFLEPDILIVDEVLAVGDAEFQKKAIGKMQDISSGEGRTVLFVSHNMASIMSLTKRCLILDSGLLNADMSTVKALDFYFNSFSFSEVFDIAKLRSNHIAIKQVLLFQKNEIKSILDREFDITIKIIFRKFSKKKVGLNLRVKDSNGFYIFSTSSMYDIDNKDLIGNLEYSVTFPKNIFNTGYYLIDVGSVSDNQFDFIENDVIKFEILENKRLNGHYGKGKGAMKLNLTWST